MQIESSTTAIGSGTRVEIARLDLPDKPAGNPMVKLLIDHEANNGKTPLHLAVGALEIRTIIAITVVV